MFDRFARREWGTLVLDEAQAIKNPTTLRARAVEAYTTLRSRFAGGDAAALGPGACAGFSELIAGGAPGGAGSPP